MGFRMFRNREDAAGRLSEELKKVHLYDPVVLGIPRGGVVTGGAIARELGADLDVVLVRKLRHPAQPELAIGSVTEEGEVYMNEQLLGWGSVDEAYLERERQERYQELRRRRDLFREIRSAVPLRGRSVILTDDGIATGSTMLAALPAIRAQEPRELILAVPVAPPGRLEPFRSECDQVICLEVPTGFQAIGQYYEQFPQVSDAEACSVLQQFVPAVGSGTGQDRQDDGDGQ